MEETEDGKPRGSEWEVVSLTASAYASAPGPDQVELNQFTKDDKGNFVRNDEAETSRAMFMSGHFVFPPSQHENLPLEPENTDMNEDSILRMEAKEELEGMPITKEEEEEEEKYNFEKLNVAHEFPGIQCFDETGKRISISGSEFEEHSIYNTETFSEVTTGDGKPVSEEPIEQNLCSDVAKSEDQYDGSTLPCEAWWKRGAASVYAHAKEANSLWSIFIAAAVMGLVILGQHWQQERWQIMQQKWQFGINDEWIGRMLNPISRFKDVLVGSHRRGSLIRGSASTDR